MANLDMYMTDKLNFNDLFLNEVCVGRICARVCSGYVHVSADV